MKVLILLALLPLLAGCMTTTLYALPEAGPGQETVYQDGRKVVMSQKTGSLVLMTPATTTFSSDDDNAFFRVLARNDSRARHDFSLDNIRATVNGGTLRLWTHEALVAKAERDRRRAAAAMIFAGGLQAQSAAMAAGQQSHYGNIYSPGMGATTFSGTTYNPAAAQAASQAAQMQTLQNVEAVNRMAESQRETAGLALGRTTLHPDGYHEGIVVTDPVRRGSDVRFYVDFAGETHNFVFRIEEIAY